MFSTFSCCSSSLGSRTVTTLWTIVIVACCLLGKIAHAVSMEGRELRSLTVCYSFITILAQGVHVRVELCVVSPGREVVDLSTERQDQFFANHRSHNQTFFYP